MSSPNHDVLALCEHGHEDQHEHVLVQYGVEMKVRMLPSHRNQTQVHHLLEPLHQNRPVQRRIANHVDSKPG